MYFTVVLNDGKISLSHHKYSIHTKFDHFKKGPCKQNFIIFVRSIKSSDNSFYSFGNSAHSKARNSFVPVTKPLPPIPDLEFYKHVSDLLNIKTRNEEGCRHTNSTEWKGHIAWINKSSDSRGGQIPYYPTLVQETTSATRLNLRWGKNPMDV